MMRRRMGRMAGAVAAAAILLTGCKTYPGPGFGPTEPAPPPAALAVYASFHPVPLPHGLPGGLLKGVFTPPTSYAAGEGLLIPVPPSKGGPADGLYLYSTATGTLTRVERIAPGPSRDVATSSAVGDGYIAYQIGPESGPRTAPVELQAVPGGAPHAITLPKRDRGGIHTLMTIQGGYLDFLTTRESGDNDLTGAVACRLPNGPCKNLMFENSGLSQTDVIALTADAGWVYVALKPADPGDSAFSALLALPQNGGPRRVLWRGAGVITSVVAAQAGLLFTADYGTDEALYFLRQGGLSRLTAPSQFPSHPSFGAGYVTWWSQSPFVFDIGSDRVYRVPGVLPQLFGDLLTYITPQGVRWVRLPPG
ncbi:MAG: hypothetical protein M0Z66_06775 [Thermaerobacter sp.]|nr:hypothetical protein [Thermaerobacter sp.]